MKQKTDPRHLHRQHLIKMLFANSFHDLDDPDEATAQVLEHLTTLDQVISSNAPEWPINQINKVDLAILRLAVYEIDFTSTPHKVIIDEAVELAKEFGSDTSAKFINGVLGSHIKTLARSNP